MSPTGVTASQSDIALALARLMAAQGYSMVETKRLVELERSASGIVQVRDKAIALALAAGKLNIALDGQERYRLHRTAVVAAMDELRQALSALATTTPKIGG